MSMCKHLVQSLVHTVMLKVQLLCRKRKERQMKSLSRVRLFGAPWTVAYQAPPSMGFSKQGYWSRLPFPSPGDLPDPGIEPRSPTLQADALPSEPPIKRNKLKQKSFAVLGLSCGMWDLSSSLTRDQTWATCFGNTES